MNNYICNNLPEAIGAIRANVNTGPAPETYPKLISKFAAGNVNRTNTNGHVINDRDNNCAYGAPANVAILYASIASDDIYIVIMIVITVVVVVVVVGSNGSNSSSCCCCSRDDSGDSCNK